MSEASGVTREAQRKLNDRRGFVRARQRADVLEVLNDDLLDPLDIVQVEGQGAAAGLIDSLPAVLLPQAQELLALAQLGPGELTGQ